jgi:hypothetical protein
LGADGELGEEEVLLLRVRELAAWSASEEYVGVMEAAPQLRRVLLPPALRSTAAAKPAAGDGTGLARAGS